jgi:hypothetical protein
VAKSTTPLEVTGVMLAKYPGLRALADRRATQQI